MGERLLAGNALTEGLECVQSHGLWSGPEVGHKRLIIERRGVRGGAHLRAQSIRKVVDRLPRRLALAQVHGRPERLAVIALLGDAERADQVPDLAVERAGDTLVRAPNHAEHFLGRPILHVGLSAENPGIHLNFMASARHAVEVRGDVEFHLVRDDEDGPRVLDVLGAEVAGSVGHLDDTLHVVSPCSHPTLLGVFDLFFLFLFCAAPTGACISATNRVRNAPNGLAD